MSIQPDSSSDNRVSSDGGSNDSESVSKSDNSDQKSNTSVAQPTSTNSQTIDTSECERECRICREREREQEELISPCNCRGSIAYIHKRCLKRCIEITRKVRCSICRGSYRHVDIQIRFQGLFSYTLSNPLLCIFYAFSISSLLCNQMLLMHRTIQFQHRQYLHFQRRLLLLRQLTTAYELPQLHFESSDWDPTYSKASTNKPIVQPLWLFNKSQSQCNIFNHSNKQCVSGVFSDKTEHKTETNESVQEATKFQIEPQITSIWLRWRRRLSSMIFAKPKLKPTKSFENRLNTPQPMPDQEINKLKRRLRDNLQKQQANLFFKYLVVVIFHLANDFMHIFSLSLFLWYLWDNFNINFTVWKARNALFRVII